MRNPSLDSFIIILVNEDSPYGITRRGIFYKVVSAGFYPGTQLGYYKRLGTVLKRLREREKLNEENILDSTRIRRLPYVFSTPGDYLLDIEDGYQKDLWENQPNHLEVFSEKDAMSSVLSSITDKYRITYNMIRGYVSDSAIYRIAQDWISVPEDKGIHALYVGDHDPSGKNLEGNIKFKIRQKVKFDSEVYDMPGRFDSIWERVVWKRIAAATKDLDAYSGSLIPCKTGDTRTPAYMTKYGDRCLEVDAIDMEEIVSRLEKAILKRIEKDAWEKSLAAEVEEQRKLGEAILQISERF